MIKKYLNVVIVLIFLSCSTVFAETSTWQNNAISIMENTDKVMESIIWSEDSESREYSDNFKRCGNEFRFADDLSEVNLATEKYILNINRKIPLTRDLAYEYCRILNLKLFVYCVFSDILYCEGGNNNLVKGLSNIGLTTFDYFVENSKLKFITPDNSIELKFALWLDENLEKNTKILNQAKKSNLNRSTTSKFIDGSYSKEISKKVIDDYYTIVQDEIPYEWKTALIKWSKLLSDWNTSLKNLKQVVQSHKRYPNSNLKALAQLESFITNANQWILAKDLMTRSVLFDEPLSFYTNLAYFRCQYANAGLFDNNDYLIKAGVSFAKTSPFITYIVDEETREFISHTKQCLKGSLSNSEYNQLIGWSKATPHWFEKPKGLNL